MFGFFRSVVFHLPVSLDRHGKGTFEKQVCHRLSILTWLGSLHYDWAACDKGREKFNHELILQSVQKVDISDPWAVPGEDVGNLQMCTQHTSVTALFTTLFLYSWTICVMPQYACSNLFPVVGVVFQVLSGCAGELTDDCLSVTSKQLHMKLIDGLV